MDLNHFKSELELFNPRLGVERAPTPPSSWYEEPFFLKKEQERVFLRSWQAVGGVDQLKGAGSFFSGNAFGNPYLVCRNNAGEIQAFYNVCRHHASEVVKGEGKGKSFVCPYHGWTYDLDGQLIGTPQFQGSKDFDPARYCLKKIPIQVWGPLIFLYFGKEAPPSLKALERLKTRLDGTEFSELRFYLRETYELDCNWKVYADNYLDGGYHVACAHPDLASELRVKTYQSEVSESYSIQSCESSKGDRLGREAIYAFIYPNFMINRYGPVMDTNWVVPTGVNRCRVIFDYYFEEGVDLAFKKEAVKASRQVQKEDIEICESVQRGLESTAYTSGRYAPEKEIPAFEFHKRLFSQLRESLNK